jgi:hypothetical protein
MNTFCFNELVGLMVCGWVFYFNIQVEVTAAVHEYLLEVKIGERITRK